MADRIKGITVVLGGDTKGLSKALTGVNKEIRNTQTQLKDVEKLLKLDPGNTQLLEQKQRLLSEAVSNTKNKLDALREAEKQVQEQFARGEVSQQQYDGLQREIVATESELKKAEQAAYDFQEQLIQGGGDKALKDLKDAAADLDRQLEQIDKQPIEDLSDAADRAEEDLKDLQGQAQKTGSALETISSGTGKVSSAMAPVTAAISGLGAAAVATVPATKELRADLSKLDANAKENAVSVEAAREAYRKLAVQSGETDSAVEATSNLLQAGFTESNLQKAVEGLAGAAQRFPDTLKIESLGDSLQETLATGSATGQFGELLDRLGVGAENFSEQLAQCATDTEKQNLALETLANAGLNDTYNEWAKNNAEMLANEEANLKLQESMAKLAETTLPIVTEVTEAFAGLMEWFTGLDSGVQIAIGAVLALVAAISPVTGIVSSLAKVIPILGPVASSVIGVITTAVSGLFTFITGTMVPGITAVLQGLFAFIVANPVILTIAAIVVAVVGLAAIINQNAIAITAALQSVNNFLTGIFATDWTNVFGPVLGSVMNAFMANLKNIWDSIYQILNGVITFVTGVFSGDWKQAWEGVKQIFKGIFDGLVAIVKAPLNGIIGLINAVIGAINSMISGLNSVSINVPDGVPGLGGKHIGFNIRKLPTVPYLAKGGTVLSGSAIVGEAGPELLTVSPGSTRVQPLTASGGTNVPVSAVTSQEIISAAQMIVSAIENSPVIIGDEQIGRANARYVADRAIVTGGAF